MLRKFSIKVYNPWLGIFLAVSKIDENENFGSEVLVNYRISVLNNTMQKTTSVKASRRAVFKFDEKIR